MTDVDTPPVISFWLPGEKPPRPDQPLALADDHRTAVRLQTDGSAEADVRQLGPGVYEVVFRRTGDCLSLTAAVAADDAVAWWQPGSTAPHSTIPPIWAGAVDATALQGIPVGALLTGQDTTRLVYAVDAGTHVTQVRAGLVEESADFVVRVTVAAAGGQGDDNDEIRLYLDTSARPFAEAVPEAGAWLQGIPGHRAAPGAEDPVLCTWYFAHQHVTAAAVLAAADRAAELGFGTVIIDDGWQTTTHGRGYGSCGDWQVAAAKFPDPAELVSQLRRRGLRTVWWVGTPFLGHRADAGALGLATLYDEPDLDAAVLDPRDPRTRAHLVERITDLVAGTGADGVKLDFLERFTDRDASGESVTAAAVRMIQETVTAVRELGVEPLVEFREPYSHPVAARHASMIRVGDCPLSAVQNRVGIVDLRLARPGTPIHSDPIMWAPGESPARVAHHLINSLFGVPQVSVDLTRLPAGQAEALAFWMRVWRANRDLLLHGEFQPQRPDLLYPVVGVHDGDRHLIARYAPHPVAVPGGDWRELLIANADDSAPVLLSAADRTAAELRIWDARGRLVVEDGIVLAPGPHTVGVPAGGLARLRRVHPGAAP